MSKDTLTEKDKELANAIVGIYKNVEDMTLIGAEYNERNYKLFTSRIIELEEELDSTPKIFKKKRAKLEQQIKDMQELADTHFNNYLAECQDLYNLHTAFFKGKREEV